MQDAAGARWWGSLSRATRILLLSLFVALAWLVFGIAGSASADEAPPPSPSLLGTVGSALQGVTGDVAHIVPSTTSAVAPVVAAPVAAPVVAHAVAPVLAPVAAPPAAAAPAPVASPVISIARIAAPITARVDHLVQSLPIVASLVPPTAVESIVTPVTTAVDGLLDPVTTVLVAPTSPSSPVGIIPVSVVPSHLPLFSQPSLSISTPDSSAVVAPTVSAAGIAPSRYSDAPTEATPAAPTILPVAAAAAAPNSPLPPVSPGSPFSPVSVTAGASASQTGGSAPGGAATVVSDAFAPVDFSGRTALSQSDTLPSSLSLTPGCSPD